MESVCGVITDAVFRRVADAEPVNLAFGTRTSLNSLTDQLEDVLGRTANFFPIHRRRLRSGLADMR